MAVLSRPRRAIHAAGESRLAVWCLGALMRFALWGALALMLLVPTACFLLIAFSPAVFDQGPEWLTIEPFAAALRGRTLVGLANSLAVGTVAAVAAATIASGLAWLLQRTTLPGRWLWGGMIWALMLMPTFLAVAGWESLIEPGGLLAQRGVDASPLRQLVFGPVGVTWILTMKGLPFAYLTVAATMLGLGREFEDAARVHGAGPWASLRVTLPILSPALWSAFAIVFAESVSDFGVASTLAAAARFPVATYALYQAVSTMPVRFPVAAAVGWFLVVMVGLALVVQYRSLKGRSFAVLSGRTRPVTPRPLGAVGQTVALGLLGLLFGLALGVPVVGAMAASLFEGYGGTFGRGGVTLARYQAVVGTADLAAPILLSVRLAAITGVLAVAFGVVLARLLSRRTTGAARGLDLMLLGAAALPSIVLGAGYIFAYNLPLVTDRGLRLYGTQTLLTMAYLAASLPVTTRMLVGPMAQLQGSLLDAARVHGAGEARAWATAVLPLLARGLVWAWLLTFAHIVFELPISELLYPPSQAPLPVAVVRMLERYDYGGGAAVLVTAILGVLVVAAAILGLSRLLLPRGLRARRPA